MLVLLLIVLGLTGACTPPDCDHVDHGSCVEACCKLMWHVKGVNASHVAKALEQQFQEKGPDGRYSFWGTTPDQGPLSFVVQGKHFTINNTYVDSLSFGIYDDDEKQHTAIQAFSHSQDFIKGDFAYGDRGQNYKNLVFLFKSLKLPYEEHIMFGCPRPKHYINSFTLPGHQQYQI